MRALRAEVPAPDPDGSPLFWSLESGMASLVQALVSQLRARGVDFRLSSAADGLEPAGQGWRVTAGGWSGQMDGVVLATPAGATAPLFRPLDDETADLLDAIDSASVVVVTFRTGADCLPGEPFGTGFLVPRRSTPAGRDPWAVTACTYLDRKWPHLARPGEVLLRASLGRVDDTRTDEWTDAEVAARAWDDLAALCGVTGQPVEHAVTRFPRAFPQYRVHHPLRVAGVEAAVARLGGLAVAGAAYHGVGIPACIASGRAAARALR